MTKEFSVYHISYEEVARRLEARYDRKQGAIIAVVEFSFEEPIFHFFFGKTFRTSTSVTMTMSRQQPYTRITVGLDERKFLGVLFFCSKLCFGSFVLGFMYWVLALWFVPFLLMFKAIIFWIFIHIRIAQKLENFVADLKRSLAG